MSAEKIEELKKEIIGIDFQIKELSLKKKVLELRLEVFKLESSAALSNKIFNRREK